jgi:protein ImuA
MVVPNLHRSRSAIIADLQRLLSGRNPETGFRTFTFGASALDNHLPERGLNLGALHEFLPRSGEDRIAAFGFAVALLSRLPRTGPVLIVLVPRGTALGRIYGHGLATIGLDPNRVLLVEAGNGVEASWAIEEALKSKVPAAVLALGAEPDFKTARRLHLAAEKAGLPLLLLGPGKDAKSSAGASRWRIGSAKAARDRFGLLTRWRWRVVLERCRNGRPGEWLVEFDHETHCFSLAQALANRAVPESAGEPSLARRSG